VFEIGSSLRQARQQRELSVADVERATRIRAKYLAALEEDLFDVLPGPAYVRGFLRTYAEELGLDGNLLVDAYNERHAPAEDDLPPIQPAGLASPAARVARPTAILALGLVVFGGVAVWQLGFTTAKRTAIPPVANAAVAPVRHVAKPKAKHAAPKRHAVTPPGTLVVRAVRGDCWVLVRAGSATGPVLYERILGRGGTVRFGLKQKLWVRLGAPWNADVTARGKALGPFPRQIVNLTAA
jgi:cytoskeletal protein RodZ